MTVCLQTAFRAFLIPDFPFFGDRDRQSSSLSRVDLTVEPTDLGLQSAGISDFGDDLRGISPEIMLRLRRDLDQLFLLSTKL